MFAFDDVIMFSVTHWKSQRHVTLAAINGASNDRPQAIVMMALFTDGGLWPVWHQAIIWANADILLIGLLGTNVREILIKIQ